MSLVKSAQHNRMHHHIHSGSENPLENMMNNHFHHGHTQNHGAHDFVLLDEEDSPIEVSDGKAKEIIFVLDKVPGALDQDDIEVEEPNEIEVEAPEEIEIEEKNPWDWHSLGHSRFLDWLKDMITNVPKHSGKDTTGLEKAIAYFEAVDKEITKAMRADYKNEIDSAKAEEARAEIESGLERLIDRLEKVKATKYKRHSKKTKKANEDFGLIKEAQKATHVGGIVVVVPLFISRLARVCINGMVSAGHDIETTFDKLNKKYKLTNREQVELIQLIEDMGYQVRRDRGFDIDEDIDTSSSDNMDWAANYRG